MEQYNRILLWLAIGLGVFFVIVLIRVTVTLWKIYGGGK